MKKLLLALFIAPLSLFAQKNINFDDSGELIRKGIELHENEKYNEAIKLYNKISINDTNYALAQYEVALSYMEMKLYVTAQEVLKQLLEQKIRFDFKQLVYVQLGNAYDENKEYDKAIATYTEGLKYYPHQANLLYNRGVSYELQKKYPEAMADYQTAIKNNIYHGGSHIRLGLMAANQGLNYQALLSLATFVWLDPNDSRAVPIIQVMEKISDGSYEKEGEAFQIYKNGDPYEDYNLLFTNKIALQKNYKAKLSLETMYGKQLHLFLKDNAYKGETECFWNNFYLPFYSEIWVNKKFDIFNTLTLLDINNPKVQSKVKSSIKKLKDFYGWSKGKYTKLHEFQELDFEGKQEKVYVEYTNKGLDLKGHVGSDGTTPIGTYYHYHSNGLQRMISYRDDKGTSSGKWNIYNNFDGQMERTVEFIDKDTRIFEDFYGDNKRSERYTIKNDLMTDSAFTYYRNGSVKTRVFYKDGKKDGKYFEYYPNGTLQDSYSFTAGVEDGKYIGYHPNGVIADEFEIVKGKINGVKKRYHDNGKLRFEYTIVEGEYEGPFTVYYYNGQIEEKGTFKKGEQVGLFESFYSNGQKFEVKNLDESGKQNGVSSISDIDGKKFHEFEYSKGDVNKVTFFDKSGKSTVLSEKKGKKIEFQRNFPNGSVYSKGNFVNGEKEGYWMYYDSYGNLERKERYSEGIQVDSLIDYHSNGKVSTLSLVKEGQRNGLYLSYNIFGDLVTEGSFKNNEWDGDRYNYYYDGSIDNQAYFLEGTKHGYQKEYFVNGKVKSIEQFDKGRMISNIYNDTNNRILDSFEEYNGEIKLHLVDSNHLSSVGNYINGNANGMFTWYSPNKVIEVKGEYINGERVGKWTWFHPSGKVETEVNYLNGNKNGLQINYHENGKKSSESNYLNGSLEGTYVYYHENGKESIKGDYLDNERHGKFTTYSLTGAIMLIRYYNQGVIESYSYILPSGEESKPVTLTKNELKVISYFKNGKKAMEHTRVNGLISGGYITYHENGTKYEEENYEFGEENGQFYEYNDAGVKMREVKYVKGVIEGEEIIYHSNGKIKSSTIYLHGIKNGAQKEYSADGKLIKTTTFFNDDAVSIK